MGTVRRSVRKGDRGRIKDPKKQRVGRSRVSRDEGSGAAKEEEEEERLKAPQDLRSDLFVEV